MEDPGSPKDIQRRMKPTASLNDAEAEQLHHLLHGVHAAATRMAELAPVFPDEVDTNRLSETVEGDDA